MTEKLLSARVATIYAILLMISAHTIYNASELRNYSIAPFSILFCFLSMGLAISREDYWKYLLIAIISGVFAMWLHALAVPAIGIIFGWGLLYSLLKRPSLILPILGAGLIAALGFLPWFWRIGGQLSYLRASNLDWVTEPTITNLLAVPLYWYPGGRLLPSLDSGIGWSASILLACSTLLYLVVIRMLLRRSRGSLSTILAVGGLAIAGMYILILWVLTRIEFLTIFHAPRYPTLVFPLWLFGLTVAVFPLATEGQQWLKQQRLFVILWAGVSIFGIGSIFREKSPFIAALRELQAERSTAVVYVYPEQFTSSLATVLGDTVVLPISAVVNEQDEAIIAGLPTWMPLSDQPSVLAISLLQRLAEEAPAEVTDESARHGSLFYRVDSVRGQSLVELRNVVSRALEEHPLPPGIVLAHPSWQRSPADFHPYELLEDGTPASWSSHPQTTLRFRGNLPAGEHQLRIILFRQPFPEPVESMTLSSRQLGIDAVLDIAAGVSTLEISFRTEKEITDPMIRIGHRLWRFGEKFDVPTDPRLFGFMLIRAEIESATSP